MNNAQMLIERLRRKLPKATNYAVAKALEMTPSSVADVISGKYGLGPKAVIRLHELLEMDVRDILVLIEEDKARTPTDKEFWARRSPRISAAIALAIVAFGAAGLSKDAQANDCMNKQLSSYPVIHYANLRKYLTFAKRLFSSLILYRGASWLQIA